LKCTKFQFHLNKYETSTEITLQVYCSYYTCLSVYSTQDIYV